MASVRKNITGGSFNAISGALPAVATAIGDCVVVLVGLAVGSARSVSTITDTAGNSYSKATGIAGGSAGVSVEIWTCIATAGAASNVITVTNSGSGKFTAETVSYTSVTAIGNVNSSSSASADPGTLAVTTQDNNNWVVGGWVVHLNVTMAAYGAGVTLNRQDIYGIVVSSCLEDITNATPAALTLGETGSGTAGWVAAAIELRTSQAAPPPPPTGPFKTGPMLAKVQLKTPGFTYVADPYGSAAPTVPLGLVGYWPLDDGTGSTATDKSGNGNTGSLISSPAWVPGKFGDALQFGTANWVEVADNAALQFTGGFSICAWAYLAQAPSQLLEVIVRKATGGTSNSANYDWWIQVLGNLAIQYGLCDSGNSQHTYSPGSNTAPLNGWHHLAMTYDGATITLYLDGVQLDQHALAVTVRVSAGYKVIFGDGVNHAQNSTVDDPRAYDRVLTAQEVLTLATSPPITVAPRTDFNLLSITTNGGAEGVASTFNLEIEDSGQVLLGKILLDTPVDIWAGRSGEYVKFFSGRVTGNKTTVPALGRLVYEVAGFDWTQRLTRRIGNFSRFQKKQSDGVTVDSTDQTTELGNLVKLVLTDKSAYPTQQQTVFQYEGIEYHTVGPGRANLVLYLPLDEGSGTTPGDVSGNGNNATATGSPTWASGQNSLFGHALTFDGSTNYLTVQDAATLDIPGPFTIAAWVYVIATPGSVTSIVIKGLADNNRNYALQVTNAGAFRVSFGTGSAFRYVDATTGYSTGAWHHVVGVYDMVNLSLYVDGILVAQGSYSDVPVANNTALGIGAEGSGAGKLNATIDDVKVINRAMSDGDVAVGQQALGEVAQLYAGTGYNSTIASTGISIPSYVAPYKRISDILNDLAAQAGCVWWVDEEKILHFAFPEIVDSLALITDDPATGAAWNDQSRVLYAVDDAVFSFEDTSADLVNRLYGLGGTDSTVIDQSSTSVVGGADKINANWIAFQFAPTQETLQYIGIYVNKTGTPTGDLQGYVFVDVGGVPGALVKQFTVPVSTVLSGGGWVQADIGSQTVLVGQKYWIALAMIGDSGNTYGWYHDSGTSGRKATSTDGTGMDSYGVDNHLRLQDLLGPAHRHGGGQRRQPEPIPALGGRRHGPERQRQADDGEPGRGPGQPLGQRQAGPGLLLLHPGEAPEARPAGHCHHRPDRAERILPSDGDGFRLRDPEAGEGPDGVPHPGRRIDLMLKSRPEKSRV